MPAQLNTRLLVFLALLFTSVSSFQANEAVKFAEGIPVPWGMTQLPDGRFLVTERSGNLYLVDATGNKTEVTGLPEISVNGQGGLLDVIQHPEYARNGWLYFSYSSKDGEGEGENTTIMRAKLKGNELVEQQRIYKASPNVATRYHFGSRMAFDNEGYLYFSIGDRGQRDKLPQDLNMDGGKIYRVHDDGRIPKDNPFVKGPKPAAYSYGHRNPQGMAKDPRTGKIWTHEHGPRGGDEVNIIEPGKNYGWPVISYGINYNGTSFTDLTEKEGMEQPVYYWDPSIAPSGMVFVTGDKYPEWQGKLLIGSLKFNYLVLCHLEGDKIIKTEVVQKDIGRVRNLIQAADGYIYVATDNGGLYKLEPGQ